jgi:hypothetical protein
MTVTPWGKRLNFCIRGCIGKMTGSPYALHTLCIPEMIPSNPSIYILIPMGSNKQILPGCETELLYDNRRAPGDLLVF